MFSLPLIFHEELIIASILESAKSYVIHMQEHAITSAYGYLHFRDRSLRQKQIYSQGSLHPSTSCPWVVISSSQLCLSLSRYVSK